MMLPGKHFSLTSLKRIPTTLGTYQISLHLRRCDSQAMKARTVKTMREHMGHGSSKASIKVIVVAVLSVLTFMIVGILSWLGASAWSDHSIARNINSFDAYTNRYVAGVYEMLLDRVETSNALQNAEPASPAVLAKIEASRKVIKDNFDSGLDGI